MCYCAPCTDGLSWLEVDVEVVVGEAVAAPEEVAVVAPEEVAVAAPEGVVVVDSGIKHV